MRLRKGLLAQYKIKFIMPKYEGTQSYKRAIKMGATIIKDSSELPHIGTNTVMK